MAESPLPHPPLRVDRTVSACSRCRTAKVRCDGKLPACTACEKSGRAQECRAWNDQFAKGKERGYMASLEARMEKLQKRLAALDSLAPAPEHRTGSGAKPTEDPSASSPTTDNQKPVDASEIDDLVADLGSMAIHATTRDFSGFTNDISFARMALRAATVSDELRSTPCAELPPRERADKLIRHYMEHVFPLLPSLNEAAFLAVVDNLYQKPEKASQFDYFCTFMVLAIATATLSRARNSSAAHDATRYVATALKYADPAISPSSIIGVQAMVLLTEYALLEPTQLDAWYLIGTASRMMVDIGLHQEPPKVSKKKALEAELRRRVFFCIYALDRAISTCLQRPYSFVDESVLVHLPQPGQPLPSSIATATHLFRIRQLQSGWYTELHLSGTKPLPQEKADAFVATQDALVQQWLEQTPENIPASARTLLNLEFHCMKVCMARPSARIPQPGEAARRQLFTHCVAYVRLLRDLLMNERQQFYCCNYHDGLRSYYVGSSLLLTLDGPGKLALDQAGLSAAREGIEAVRLTLTQLVLRWPILEPMRNKFLRDAEYAMTAMTEHYVLSSSAVVS